MVHHTVKQCKINCYTLYFFVGFIGLILLLARQSCLCFERVVFSERTIFHYYEN